MERFDLLVGPECRLVLLRVAEGFSVRLQRRKAGKWVFLTPATPIALEELRDYEQETRAKGKRCEWRFPGAIWLRWEWRHVTVLYEGEIWGQGDRSLWEAAVRRMLAGSP